MNIDIETIHRAQSLLLCILIVFSLLVWLDLKYLLTNLIERMEIKMILFLKVQGCNDFENRTNTLKANLWKLLFFSSISALYPFNMIPNVSCKF